MAVAQTRSRKGRKWREPTIKDSEDSGHRRDPTPLLKASERVRLEIYPVSAPPWTRFKLLTKSCFSLFMMMGKAASPGRADPREMGTKVRELLESLGGFWLKMGQLLALRQDVFPLDFCNEVSKLQDKAYAFSPKVARRIIENDLGRPIEELFEEFVDDPIAAASLAQVHKARLRNRSRTWVAVKVQKPHADEYFNYDFRFMSLVFGFFGWLGWGKRFRWDEMLRELRRMIDEELEYRYEAASLKRMRKNLKAHRIRVPRVFLKRTSKRVLTMEFMEGVFMSDYIQVSRKDPERLKRWLDENNIDPTKVAKRLLMSLMQQINEDNLFHGDLHPGNIVLYRNSRIGLIDMGNVGTTDADTLALYDLGLKASMAKRYSAAADYNLMLVGELPEINLNAVKSELVGEMRAGEMRASMENLPFHEKSMSKSSENMGQIYSKYKLGANWALLRIGRTWASLDLTLGVLAPKINYLDLIKKYSSLAAKRRRWASLRQLPNIGGVVTEAKTLLGTLLRAKGFVFQGGIGKLTRALGLLFSLMFWTFAGVIVFLSYAFVYKYHDLLDGAVVEGGAAARLIEALPKIGYIPSLLLLFLLGMLAMRFRRFVREFREMSSLGLPGMRNNSV